MGKMKRFFSLMLVLTIVLGSFGSVFAAEEVAADEELKKVPSDVIGTEYEKAVARLVAFGVLDGYKDGTYRPDQDVTRAEFAKILVEALGIGNAAKAAAGKVTFTDVPASHWASGYVSTASGYGLLVGFPDGTFKPEQQVSYADALTMLVRALGYQDSFLKGAWPGSHIAKAAEAGITSGVNFADARGFANRGKVAQMVNNTLDCDVVKVETYKDGTVEYKETEVTLLKDKLDISKYEDTRVIADKIVDDGLDTDEIKVLFTKDIDKKDEKSVKKSYDEGDKIDFRILKGANPRRIIGEKASLYVDNRDKVVYIESQNDDKAYFDYVDGIEDGKDGEIKEISLVRFDKEYKFDEEAVVYVLRDNQYRELTVDKKDGIKADISEILGKVGKFVVKNNRIIYAEIMESTEAPTWMLVRENDKGILKGINETTEDFDIDLNKDGSYDGVLVFDTLGNKLDVKDIEKGNILYASKLDYDGDDYAHVVVVQDNIIEGKLTRVKDDRVGIDDKEYKVIKYDGKYDQTFYSVEGFEDIKKWDPKDDDWANDMEDADEENVIAYLNAAGRVAYLSAKAEDGSAGYKYGIVTKAFNDNDRIRIYTYIKDKDGEEITYKVDKEKTMTNAEILEANGQKSEKNAKTRQVVNGDVVKFKLNKDGEIAKEELYVMNPDNYWVMRKDDNKGKDFGKDSIPSMHDGGTNKTNFAIDERAVIIDGKGLEFSELDAKGLPVWKNYDDADKFGIANWKDMKEDNYDSELRYFVFTKRNKPIDIDAVVFFGTKGASTSSDKEAIYVINKELKGGDVFVEYVSYETGKVEKAEVEKIGSNGSPRLGDIEKQRPYIAKIRSNGKLELYNTDEDDLSYESGVVTNKDGNLITVNDNRYKLSNDAVVYEKDNKKSASNIVKGDAVLFIAENDVNIRVIERLVEKEAEEVKEGKDPNKDPEEKLEGIVTYINQDDQTIEIDNDEIFEVKKTTKFVEDGKTLAIGSAIVAQNNKDGVKEGDQVKTDTKANTITLVKRAGTIEADKELKEAKDALKAKIDDAKELLAKAKEYKTDAAYIALNTEIAKAEGIYKDSKDLAEVKKAKTDLVSKESNVQSLLDNDEEEDENDALAEKAFNLAKNVKLAAKEWASIGIADIKTAAEAKIEDGLSGAEWKRIGSANVSVTELDPADESKGLTRKYNLEVKVDGKTAGTNDGYYKAEITVERAKNDVATAASVKVAGKDANLTGNTATIVLPQADIDALTASDIEVTATDENAHVGRVEKANDNKSWTVKITAEDGKAIEIIEITITAE